MRGELQYPQGEAGYAARTIFRMVKIYAERRRKAYRAYRSGKPGGFEIWQTDTAACAAYANALRLLCPRNGVRR